MADEQACKYLIPGLDRGLQLLLAFGEQHKEMTFAELHRLVDMPKATAYRVVQTLEHLGFLSAIRAPTPLRSASRCCALASNTSRRWTWRRPASR